MLNRILSARFRLARGYATAYALLALTFSCALLVQASGRGQRELLGWLCAYAVAALVAGFRPSAAPVVAGFAAFGLGFVRTYAHGPNLDLGLGLILLCVGVWLLRRSREPLVLDVPGLCLLALSLWAVLSLGFAVARIRTFVPAPGFSYHVYRFNTFGLSSEEAIVRAVLGAAAAFAWFGLYAHARSLELRRDWFRAGVVLLLVLNGAVLYHQRFHDPSFLLPAGMPPYSRLSGITSFCFALGDVVLALFLLLPLWGSRRRLRAVVTLACLGLLLAAASASGSRSALVFTVAAALCWTGWRTWRQAADGRRRHAGAAAGLLVGLVALVAGAYLATPADQASPLGRLKGGIETEGVWGHLLTTRLSSYPLLAKVIAAYPLSGLGAGLYQAEVSRQRTLLAPTLAVPDSYLLNSYAPNQLLNTGAELGAPAMGALALALLLPLLGAWRARHEPLAADLAIGVATLFAALQLGPAFYNSEAVAFFWLLIGLAAQSAEKASGPAETAVHRASPWLAAALAVGLAGHALSWPALSIDSLWRRARWPMNIGLQPPQADGRWTAAEATMSLDVQAPAVILRWHAGDIAAASYRAEVSLYMDGQLVERSLALPGRNRESVLPLAPVAGVKRLSVRVVPPFVPAEHLGGDDRRSLGILIHSITPLEAPATAPRP